MRRNTLKEIIRQNTLKEIILKIHFKKLCAKKYTLKNIMREKIYAKKFIHEKIANNIIQNQ